jgi:hypothetical protein
MIGCGDVTEKKSAPSFNKINGSSLHGVTSRSLSRALAYAERHHIPKVYDSADELVEDPEISAVYIATPPSSHAAYAIMAMRAGKPVYVEKPMASDYQGCLDMNQVSSETGMPIFVAYYRRSMEYFLKVRELLHNQAIGKVLLVQSSLIVPPREEDRDRQNLPWRVVPGISGGGYFYDMGCHGLDILSYYFGAGMVFESGLLYAGTWCFVASQDVAADTIEIIGERGQIRFSCFQFTPIEWITETGKQEFPIASPEHVQMPMIRSVVEDLQGQGTSPSKGDSGAHVNWIMDKILGKLN